MAAASPGENKPQTAEDTEDAAEEQELNRQGAKTPRRSKKKN